MIYNNKIKMLANESTFNIATLTKKPIAEQRALEIGMRELSKRSDISGTLKSFESVPIFESELESRIHANYELWCYPFEMRAMVCIRGKPIQDVSFECPMPVYEREVLKAYDDKNLLFTIDLIEDHEANQAHLMDALEDYAKTL